MTPSKPNRIVHLLPSLTDVAFLMPLLFMFTIMGGAKSLLRDGDTGWHIRTGEWILANHRVPHNDIFSFTKPGQPWFAWEWLTDVIFGWLHQHFGLAGVVGLGMLILCLTFALLFRLVRRRCSNPLIAIAFTYLAVASSSIHWHARPHLFTLFFVVVFLHILDRVRDGRTRLLAVLPPLTVLWTNLHGGFFVGIFLLGCYAAADVIEWFVNADANAGWTALRRTWRYALTAVACAIASLANPYTWHLHVFIAKYLRSPMLDMIGEFRAPDFRAPGAQNFELILLSAVALLGWAVVRRRYSDALIVGAWAHLALFSARNIPLFGLMAAPVAAQCLEEVFHALSRASIAARVRAILERFENAAADIRELDEAWRVHAASAVFIALLFGAILAAPATSKLQAAFDRDQFPVRAVPVLQQVGPGRLFTIDQWGDYLIYRLYPEIRVYMDGRSDFYGNDFVNQYCNVLNAAPGWEKNLDRYGITAVLVGVNDALAGVLKASPAWQVIYDDHKAILFTKRALMRAEQVSSVLPGQMNRDRLITQGCDPKVTAPNNGDLRITIHKSL